MLQFCYTCRVQRDSSSSPCGMWSMVTSVNLQHLGQCFVLKQGHSVAVFVQRFVDAEHDEGCQNGLDAQTCFPDRFFNPRKDFEQKRKKQHINGNNGIGNMLHADVFDLFFFFVAAQIFHRQ